MSIRHKYGIPLEESSREYFVVEELPYGLSTNSDLAILPGKHGAYLGAIEYLENGKWKQTYAVDIIEEFLNNKTASH